MSTPIDPQQHLAKLVGFDTTSRHSNRALIDYVRDYLDGLGVGSDIVAEGDKACLWATIGKSDAPGIILAGHTDVVPVDDQNWTSDPFKLAERDGKLYARGACDMKGFIACALAFIPEFLASNPATCFHLALTSDEETDMSGAMRLTDFLAARHVKPAWVWVGEPTLLSIVNQHKGVAAYSTRMTGVSGHSGQPDKGLNAIKLAAQMMTVILEAEQTRRNNPVAASVFDPPYTTFNLGTVAGGSAENIIAEKCELMWQIRAHPGERAQDIFTSIESETRRLIAPRLAAFAPQARMESCTCLDIPPLTATAGNPGEKALKHHLKCDETHAVSFGTEAGIFQKLGAAAVICGPGSIEQAHQADEFVDKSQLAACVDLMRGILLSSPAA